MDTPIPIILILTSIIMVTRLAQNRSIRTISKAMARRMQKYFVTVTSTSSALLIEPSLSKPRCDSHRVQRIPQSDTSAEPELEI